MTDFCGQPDADGLPCRNMAGACPDHDDQNDPMQSDDRCGAECRDGSPCRNYPVSGSKRCRMHGGHSPGGEPGNQNAVTHGLYAQVDNFYQSLDDDHTALCDEIFQDYCTRYRDLYGSIDTANQTRLFEIAVNQIKVVHQNDWLVDRPDTLESGNPLVERETHYSEGGAKYHRYKESVVLAGQQKLRREDRQWLKDMGLLNDPESQKAEASKDLAIWISDRLAAE